MVAFLAPFAVEVHNFSMPGATAKYHLASQLAWFFSRFSKKGQDESETVSLDPEETTYVLFLGINDCGTTDADDLEPIVDVIFDTVHQLYIRARARNFVIINVPPIDRSPAGLSFSAELEDRIETWNDLLQKETADFASGGTQATQSVFLFSSNAVLTDVLDSPVKYKFSEKDVMQAGGSIWEDELHITSSVQKVIAEQFIHAMESNL
ncbi:hypothetical protein DEU56DRAFT_747478 [Suillus clintonianus]|uniref:uncharacterized protein n=1 Tax=Suillus clintonianus TaxID=1904413 RepID=UPI001B860829|nr:uncharacterized protein DEU56DRAFT_747478 [Suillus clintonianus]KAG2119184.1 hypothetical protein DEU56DRAFT_747478 [Suillus clintonianus]